ncbi:juvenile hormone acid O-methyltransferase-like isoform X2 [Dermacentor silvarum]|uniref:juvenile hormone acid O-methyltransferase-like isoform X2 n=1 Tax=Dermacentor silvarum TaxID=543639 RepID=UPI0021013CC3|nr:juvenile hormone acid O-methyltransferase-like isoform X2 [Dermacentor silvarum]
MSHPDATAQGVSHNVVTFRPHQFEGDKRMPRQHIRWMLEFCQKVFRNEPDETQQFLDVGCGIGDLTRDELLPRCLPCRRIVAVDVSSEMVEHAASHYQNDKLEFRRLDIVSDEEVVDQLAPKTQDMNYDECLEYISRILAEAGLSPSILELPVCTMLDNHSLQLLADICALKSPLTAVVSEDEKQQFLIDLAQETAKMHSPDVDYTQYRIYVIKASKRKDQSCDSNSRS